MGMTHVISARVNDLVYAEINDIAADRHRKVSEIIQEALVNYLDNYADYHIGLDRLNDPNDEIMNDTEFFKRLQKKT
jgi:predicted DNA-binding protein